MDSKKFLSEVVILCDTREKENRHIVQGLADMGVRSESQKLDIGDYSFRVGNKDFSTSCAIERKASPDELYGNIMEKAATVSRFEKELDAASRALKQLVLLIEGVPSMDGLKQYVVPDWQMRMTPQRKVSEVGATCYAKAMAWAASDRYGLRIEFVEDKKNAARKIVEIFYYYFRAYSSLIAARRR